MSDNKRSPLHDAHLELGGRGDPGPLEQGEAGLQPHLSAFFKSPVNVDRHELQWQFDQLQAYATKRAPKKKR